MAANFNDNIIVRFESSDALDNAFTMTRACTLYDGWSIANAAAAGTVQFFVTSSAGTAISDAVSVNGGDTTVARVGTIDNAAAVFADGGVLCVKKNNAISTTTYAMFSATGVTLA